jgi:hypothetical protein
MLGGEMPRSQFRFGKGVRSISRETTSFSPLQVWARDGINDNMQQRVYFFRC